MLSPPWSVPPSCDKGLPGQARAGPRQEKGTGAFPRVFEYTGSIGGKNTNKHSLKARPNRQGQSEELAVLREGFYNPVMTHTKTHANTVPNTYIHPLKHKHNILRTHSNTKAQDYQWHESTPFAGVQAAESSWPA